MRAGCLLLDDRSSRSLLGKVPLPVTSPDKPSIPVLELTTDGLDKLVGASGFRLGEIYGSPPALPLGIRIRMDVPLTPREAVTRPMCWDSSPVLTRSSGTNSSSLARHVDHVGDDPDGLRYSGANDDASGMAVLLEIARLWQEAGYRPALSILFAAWGARNPVKTAPASTSIILLSL